MRKSIPMFNGATLLINNKKHLPQFPNRIKFRNDKTFYYTCKNIFRKVFPIIGISGIRLLTSIVRFSRKLLKGHSIPQSELRDEMELPINKYPTIDLLNKLESFDIKEEINRRREIYLWLNKLIENLNIKPVFNLFLDNYEPFIFPFYCSNN